MKNFIRKIKEIWSIEELRQRILITLFLLVIYRVGTFIVLPGIDASNLGGLADQTSGKGLLGLINTFAGGAFARGSIFALGIMPYISASIVMQLMTMAMPSFQRLQQDGETGQKKINQYTRMLTIAITAVQGYGYLVNLMGNSGNAAGILVDLSNGGAKAAFLFTNVILLVAGTMFTMWLGERITEKGLGNGISLLITIGIIAGLPGALYSELAFKFADGKLLFFLVEMLVWIATLASVVMLVQGTRKVPINYAKRLVGNRLYGGARNYIPLKVNVAGVMPIIFAQAIMFIPPTLGSYFTNPPAFLTKMADFTSVPYNVVFAIMIILFTYFYTAITVNPKKMAEDMKRNGSFIPGIKPGKRTMEYIDKVMSTITLPGALFLAFVSVFPAFAVRLGVNNQFAQFYGGTSLLIMVGVVLDTLQHIESYLLMRHYDGLMKGRIKGRAGIGNAQSV